VLAHGRTELVDLTLTWTGGATTTLTARRPVQRTEDLSYYPELAARAIALSETGLDPTTIATRLRQEGFHSGRDDHRISWRTVDQILRRTGHDITHRRAPLPARPGHASPSTSGGEPISPPNSASPSPPSTSGASRDSSSDAGRASVSERAELRWVMSWLLEAHDQLTHLPR
jgi:hypothetical protein